MQFVFTQSIYVEVESCVFFSLKEAVEWTSLWLKCDLKKINKSVEKNFCHCCFVFSIGILALNILSKGTEPGLNDLSRRVTTKLPDAFHFSFVLFF